jgi:hypothetical protein
MQMNIYSMECIYTIILFYVVAVLSKKYIFEQGRGGEPFSL